MRAIITATILTGRQIAGAVFVYGNTAIVGVRRDDDNGSNSETAIKREAAGVRPSSLSSFQGEIGD